MAEFIKRTRSALGTLTEIVQARNGQIGPSHFEIKIAEQLAALIPGILILTAGEFLR